MLSLSDVIFSNIIFLVILFFSDIILF